MQKEAVIEEYDEEEEVEDLLDAEEELRESLYNQKSGNDIRVDLSSGITGYLSQGTVIGGERKDNGNIVLRVQHNGETKKYEVKWPDDPTDRTEPLVRLCHWNGTSISRIADIDEVPLLKIDDGWILLIPPESPARKAKVTLPGKRTSRFPYLSPISAVRFLAARVFFFLLHLRLIEVEPTSSSAAQANVTPNKNAVIPFSFSTGLITGIVGLILGGGFLVNFISGGFLALMVILFLYLFASLSEVTGVFSKSKKDN